MHKYEPHNGIDKLNELIARAMRISFSAIKAEITHATHEASIVGITHHHHEKYATRLVMLYVLRSYAKQLNTALQKSYGEGATNEDEDFLRTLAAQTATYLIGQSKKSLFDLEEENLEKAESLLGNLVRLNYIKMDPEFIGQAAARILHINFLAMDSLINHIFEDAVKNPALKEGHVVRIVLLAALNEHMLELNKSRMTLNERGLVEATEITVPSRATALLKAVIGQSLRVGVAQITQAERETLKAVDGLVEAIAKGDYTVSRGQGPRRTKAFTSDWRDSGKALEKPEGP